MLNPARGPLIREDGAAEGAARGLDRRRRARHALSVSAAARSIRLWRFPNVILTPHISGSSLSPRYRERIWDIFVQNVERFLDGRPLLNELSRDQLSGERVAEPVLRLRTSQACSCRACSQYLSSPGAYW